MRATLKSADSESQPSRTRCSLRNSCWSRKPALLSRSPSLTMRWRSFLTSRSISVGDRKSLLAYGSILIRGIARDRARLMNRHFLASLAGATGLSWQSSLVEVRRMPDCNSARGQVVQSDWHLKWTLQCPSQAAITTHGLTNTCRQFNLSQT